MGARLARAMRNFNLENRAHVEIGKQKPSSAPRHPSSMALIEQQLSNHPETNEVHNKNEELLSLLKDIYVDSKEIPAKKRATSETSKQLQEHRLLKSNLDYELFNITKVPKGKLSIVEALTILNNHKLKPDLWTADKIAEDYCLELKDVKGLLEFFKPFEIKVLPPKQINKELLTAS
ncbi:NADH dehydrogenase [ubiquinone] 1 alpha subcomplex assembly factor 4 [Hemiscyllium ocellatum]|uniref:NADH dehydrogenase [ubiquinone] 1 alpha subcomplex assembly factor 4 n=1 Tax=Hemiscyllium ocellatum TaxID=170820 RepID=UPI0029661A1E|nr:NADH dehydrogenase [ubiquinone] 1 alpha subcomplex assembly factor 4 [Hemiscyllium ocellatum]